MTIKIVSRKDGCSGNRWETFESYAPNTYDIVLGGAKIGSIWAGPDNRFPRDPRPAWLVCFHSDTKGGMFQSFLSAKRFARAFGDQEKMTAMLAAEAKWDRIADIIQHGTMPK